jgi:hypothetical protein
MTSAPWVVQDDAGVFWLFFSGWDGTNTRIGVATSANGTSFTPYAGNPVIDLGPAGAWDSADTTTPAVIPGSPWTMLFGGTDRATGSIGLAVSSDGFNWTKFPLNPVFIPDPAPAFDSTTLNAPMPLNDPSGPRLYYAGGDGPTGAIGLFMNITAYEPEGTYESRVFDSGSRLTTWQSIAETVQAPSTTSISAALRTGDTATPDSSWSEWVPADASGVPSSPLRGQYVQYRLALTSPKRTATPTVDDVTVTYAPDQGPVPTNLIPMGPDWITASPLRWTPSDPEGDSQSAFEVQVSRDPGFATINVTSGVTESSGTEWEPPALADGVWYWRVRLSDGVAWGPWQVASFRLDGTPPAVSLLAPVAGSVIGVSSIPVVWQASDLYSGVHHIELRLDDGMPVLLDASVPIYVFAGVPDGTHTVAIRVVDHVGNAVMTTAQVTVDTVRPSLRVLSPGPNAIVTSSRIELRWEADGTGSEISTYRIRFDHGDSFNASPDETAYVLINVPDGDHVVEITVFDAALNSATATVVFHVDTNLLSASGPVGPWLDAGLVIIAIAIAAALLVVHRARRNRMKPGPPPGP